VRNAVSDAVKLADASLEVEKLTAEVEKLAEELPLRKYQKAQFAVKESGFLSGALGGAMVPVVSKTMEKIDEENKKERANLLDKLHDPKHLEELRKIRTQTMLMEILNDPDNPLHGQDLSRVADEFNQIADTAPAIVDHQALLEPVLRRRMVGMSEPFEAQELLTLDRGAQGLQANKTEEKSS
jgi:hypothetical protein